MLYTDVDLRMLTESPFYSTKHFSQLRYVYTVPSNDTNCMTVEQGK